MPVLGKWEDISKWAALKGGFDEDLPTLVERVASLTRNSHPVVVSGFTSGVFNIVFHVVFDDDVDWVCRVHKNDPAVSPLCIQSKIDSTVATMRYITSRIPSFPVPKVHAFESNPVTSALHAAYIFMDFVNGFQVKQSSTEDDVVHKQLATMAMRLSELRFSKIGPIYQCLTTRDFYVGAFVDDQGVQHGPYETATQYFLSATSKIEKEHAQWRVNHVENTAQSLEMCSLYTRAASMLTDYTCGSFPLVHHDFGTHNTLFQHNADGKLELAAIIDWDGASTGTWLQFCMFPVFLGIRWPTLERGGYSQLVLDRIDRRQRIYVKQLKEEESTMPSSGERPTDLHRLVDSPAVRVVEFILEYSDPYFNCDGEMFRKYLKAWREDVDW